MAELTRPTEAPAVHEHKLDDIEQGMLRELRLIQIEHSNKIRALMGGYLSALAGSKWGYNGDQVLTFDIDMDDPKANVVKVSVTTPPTPQVAPQPATELPASHEVPVAEAAPAPEQPVEAPVVAEQPSEAPITEEQVASAVASEEAPAEPTTVPAPEAPQA